MAALKRWNPYEAAILLDGYLRIIHGELTKKEAVAIVSQKLRKMAANQGIELDDVYRNEAGVHFQMYGIESAYQGFTGAKRASKLFIETVRLYREERERFDQLLKEAEALVAGKM